MWAMVSLREPVGDTGLPPTRPFLWFFGHSVWGAMAVSPTASAPPGLGWGVEVRKEMENTFSEVHLGWALWEFSASTSSWWLPTSWTPCCSQKAKPWYPWWPLLQCREAEQHPSPCLASHLSGRWVLWAGEQSPPLAPCLAPQHPVPSLEPLHLLWSPGRVAGPLVVGLQGVQIQGLSLYTEEEGILGALCLQGRPVSQHPGSLHKLEGKSQACLQWPGAGPGKRGAVWARGWTSLCFHLLGGRCPRKFHSEGSQTPWAEARRPQPDSSGSGRWSWRWKSHPGKSSGSRWGGRGRTGSAQSCSASFFLEPLWSCHSSASRPAGGRALTSQVTALYTGTNGLWTIKWSRHREAIH